MDLSDLAGQTGEWLAGTGPEADIVISTRVRLARNLADTAFVPNADATERHDNGPEDADVAPGNGLQVLAGLGDDFEDASVAFIGPLERAEHHAFVGSRRAVAAARAGRGKDAGHFFLREEPLLVSLEIGKRRLQ